MGDEKGRKLTTLECVVKQRCLTLIIYTQKLIVEDRYKAVFY
jgi:hypothetical protein